MGEEEANIRLDFASVLFRSDTTATAQPPENIAVSISESCKKFVLHPPVVAKDSAESQISGGCHLDTHNKTGNLVGSMSEGMSLGQQQKRWLSGWSWRCLETAIRRLK